MPVANIISYNQLMQMYKDFASAHYFLNDFGNGPTSEIGTSRQMKFPYMWVTHRTPSDINLQNKTAIPEFTLSFIIVDQINNQENYLIDNGTQSDNQQEVLSDSFQTLQDLITYHQTTMGQFGVQLVDELVTVEALYDETDDKVTGWIADIKVRLRHSNCVTPLGSIILTVPGTSNISLQFLTCETLAACDTFTNAIDNLQEQINDITEYNIGDLYGGGMIASIWEESGTTYGLIVSLYDTTIGKAWSNITNVAIGTSARSYTDGLSNSQAIISQSGHTTSVAEDCLSYSGGGYTDWYLPSHGELITISNNLFILNTLLGPNLITPYAGYWSSTEQTNLQARTISAGALAGSLQKVNTTAPADGTPIRSRAVRKTILI